MAAAGRVAQGWRGDDPSPPPGEPWLPLLWPPLAPAGSSSKSTPVRAVFRGQTGGLVLEREDERFRSLVGEAKWAELPEPVRRRFSHRLGPGDMAVYHGQVVETHLSRAGRLLSFLARLIGAPLPRFPGAVGPAVATVTEDERLAGQSWTRVYARPGRAPQVVHSIKRFAGPTGLEEYLGYGVGMSLDLSVEAGALVFRSERYFLHIGARRWFFPRLLEPGLMEVVHRQEDDGIFSFRLTLMHPRLGCLVHQLAFFRDV